MRVWPLRLVLAVLMVAVCACQRLNGQTTTSGALAGVVTDQSGAVIPDANVEIRDNAKGTAQSTKTDREGAYQFFFLAPARYTLTVTYSGFREEKRTVSVLLGPAVSVNVTLAIAEARSEMTVADEVPLIQALHWLGPIVAVRIIFLQLARGQMAADSVALMILLVLAVTAYLAGIHFDRSFVWVSAVLALAALGGTEIEAYLWLVILIGLLLVGLVVFSTVLIKRRPTVRAPSV